MINQYLIERNHGHQITCWIVYYITPFKKMMMDWLLIAETEEEINEEFKRKFPFTKNAETVKKDENTYIGYVQD